MKGFDKLYHLRSDLPILGDLYQPPASFRHGEEVLVADVPPREGGQRVRLYETRMPSSFFRLEALPGITPDEKPLPGFVISTGTVPPSLIGAIAMAIANGMLGVEVSHG